MKPLNYSDTIKEAFGRYLEGFHSQLVADTPAMAEFSQRAFARSAVWAPGRLIDQIEEMLKAYRKNDNSQSGQPKTLLPIMIAAVGKDFMPSGPEYGRNQSDGVFVTLPDDPKERVFRLRAVSRDVRAQVAIIAGDEPTATSIAMQLQLYMSSMRGRTFFATFSLAGFADPWGVQIENPDLLATGSPLDEVKNMTSLAVDLTLRATIPLLGAPKPGEDNDGQGDGPNQFNPFEAGYDPSGYPVVLRAEAQAFGPNTAFTIPESTFAVGDDL